MTEVEFSRKMGIVVTYLNQAAIKRLFDAVRESNSFETLQEPYKTWVVDQSKIPLKDLRDNAKKARRRN
jgi:hypothetical protein